MGLFEKIAVGDLKFRVIIVPAGLVFAMSMWAGHAFLGGDSGIEIGMAIGLPLAVLTGYGMYRVLP